ncbi:MAG TPA: tRNA (adenosine(37)-N6)-threonylcarbamoyltransferase complex dimerization subunit type 1 TsaB [Patescibacteria group bacterium]|nr:tRNA (adenosine(37)-N6)-threonylcarbamoyltransferase complex dimerization subunit type 1 TsaB [Patescibacteria group bacterium]
MLILTIRTDKPEAEIGLFDDAQEIKYEKWEAHRKLAETIHQKIKDILDSAGKDWADIEGVVVFKGPGSFTGLRIGLAVGNALASSLNTPIIGTTGHDWVQKGIRILLTKPSRAVVIPEYGGAVHTTLPKK